MAVLVGVPDKDAEFKTHPMNFLNERTLRGTFFGNYKPRTDLPSVVEKYMSGVSSSFSKTKISLSGVNSLGQQLASPIIKMFTIYILIW